MRAIVESCIEKWKSGKIRHNIIGGERVRSAPCSFDAKTRPGLRVDRILRQMAFRKTRGENGAWRRFPPEVDAFRLDAKNSRERTSPPAHANYDLAWPPSPIPPTSRTPSMKFALRTSDTRKREKRFGDKNNIDFPWLLETVIFRWSGARSARARVCPVKRNQCK